jgi:hypothetical protein
VQTAQEPAHRQTLSLLILHCIATDIRTIILTWQKLQENDYLLSFIDCLAGQ